MNMGMLCPPCWSFWLDWSAMQARAAALRMPAGSRSVPCPVPNPPPA